MKSIKTIRVNNIWESDERVERIRKVIMPRLKRIRSWLDIQDLEHQILFRLTTYKNWEDKIDKVYKEQEYIIRQRMKNALIRPEELFCFGRQRKDEWVMKWGRDRNNLYCINGKKKKEIYFREITLEQSKLIGRKIIEDYHYIHCSRCDKSDGMMFGFFIKGDKLPFAIEQIEPCRISRNYKKAILMLSDINYHTTCELTRFYSVPNTPKNLISILDKMVGRELRSRGYEWVITATMPAYSKTRASTIAGGIDTPLFSKKLEFQFFKRDDGRYELCVNRKKERNHLETIMSVWKLPPVIEMIKPLKSELEIDLKNKFYYVK